MADSSRLVTQILLAMSVESDCLALARMTCAEVAARADFTHDEIADLRLAIEELCLSLIKRAGATGRIELLYTLDADSLRVDASIANAGLSLVAEVDTTSHEFSEQTLDALVDNHGADYVKDRPHAWLTKQRRAGHDDRRPAARR